MKNIKRIATAALSMALVASVVVASPADVDAAKATLKITAPTTKSTYTQAKKTVKLKFTVKNGTVKSVAVTSNKKKVVKVSKINKSGATLTSAGQNGQAKVTVKVTLTTGKTVKKTLTVNVKNKATKLTAVAKNSYKVDGKYIIPKGYKATYTINFKAKGSAKIGSKAVTVKNSKKTVATASYKNGKLTVSGKKAGVATITLTAKDGSGKSVKIPVKVVAKKATVTTADVAVEAGKTAQVTATVKGGTVNKIGEMKVTKGEDFVKFDAKTGIVTGVKAGVAEITIYSADSASSAVAKVTVTGSPAAFKADSKADLTVSGKQATDLLNKFEAAVKASPAEFAAVGEVKVTVGKNVYTATVDEKGVITYKKDSKVVEAAKVKAQAKDAKADKLAEITVPATADKIPALLEKLQTVADVAGDTAFTATLKSKDGSTTVKYDKVTVATDYITLVSGTQAVKLYVVDGQLYVTNADDAKALVAAGIVEIK